MLLHEPTVLVPVAFAVAYEAGVAVFRRAWAGLAVVLAQVALSGLAQGSGGAYPVLALPASTARHLLAPATIAAFFWFAERPGLADGHRLGGRALADVVHPTYVLFVGIPLVAYVLVRTVLARGELARGLAGDRLPLPARARRRALAGSDRRGHCLARSLGGRAWRGLWRTTSARSTCSRRRGSGSRPRCSGCAGAVAIVALLVLPLAAFASRRRWSAYVLGGSVSLLAILLFAVPFTPFSDAVSLSQARRVAGFLPLPFAFAGGAAVLARTLSWVALPVALGAGIALELIYPGEFTYRFHEGARRSSPGSRCSAEPQRSSSPLCLAAAGRSMTEGRCRRRRRGVRDPRGRLRVRALEHRPVRARPR